jgi:hypothetical protein
MLLGSKKYRRRIVGTSNFIDVSYQDSVYSKVDSGDGQVLCG